MAVLKATSQDRHRKFWVLIDSEADTIEVVTDGGIERPDEYWPEFAAAYYQEASAPGIGPVMLRISEVTDWPVGLLLEHASRRESFWGRLIGARRRSGPLWLAESLVMLAKQLPPADQEELLPHGPADVLRREGGEFVFAV